MGVVGQKVTAPPVMTPTVKGVEFFVSTVLDIFLDGDIRNRHHFDGFFPVSIHWDKKKIGIYLHHKPKVADSLDFCDFYPFTDLVLSMRFILATLNLLMIAIEFVLYFEVESVQFGCNYLIRVANHGLQKVSRSARFDPLGLFLNINIPFLWAYPFVLIPLLIYFELDPTYFFIKYVLRLELTTLSARLLTCMPRFLHSKQNR
ncbi:hypothetical protein Fcan01_23593 [Folsomia candida]|uniref:Uncharacterized protein n=1 Tax=Folsomia candida TaxID=158441 RepID=A0A226D8D3_FOLCA|nr:hypothetical protein Fcan01_23593 [Folsomia candida]